MKIMLPPFMMLVLLSTETNGIIVFLKQLIKKILLLKLIALLISLIFIDRSIPYAFSQSRFSKNQRLTITSSSFHIWSLKKLFLDESGIDRFYPKTGCHLEYKLIPESDDHIFNSLMIDRIDTEIAIIPWFVAQQLIISKSLSPIKTGAINNWHAIDKRIKDSPWFQSWRYIKAPKNKNQIWASPAVYALPLQWKPRLLAYNTRIFSSPPQSWRILFDDMHLEDGKPNKGRIQALGSSMAIADAALYLMGARPKLNIRTPYSLNIHQYKAALSLIHQQYLITRRYWQQSALQIDDLGEGNFVAASSWPFQINILRAANKPIAAVVPKEGLNGRLIVVVTNMDVSRKEHCFYRLVNILLQPNNQAQLAAWTGSVPVLPSACEIDDILGKDGCRMNGADYFDKVHFEYLPKRFYFQSQLGCQEKKPSGLLIKTECISYNHWQAHFNDILGRRYHP